MVRLRVGRSEKLYSSVISEGKSGVVVSEGSRLRVVGVSWWFKVVKAFRWGWRGR